MKKSLLFLASLLLNMASFAQRQKPVPATVDTYEYSTFEADGKGDTIVYYLYNKGAGGFFTEGNAWGTQASLGNTGLKVAITKYIAPSEEEGFDSEWDGATVFINDYSIAKGAWKLLFIESEEAAYVDRGSQANYFWEIKSQGGGIFRLKGAAINPDFNGDRFFGMSYYSDSETTILTPYIDLTVDNTAFVDWQFVTEAAYATYSEQIAVYEAAEKLRKNIEYAKEQGIAAADLSDYQKVYDNANSTIEELNTAAAAAYDKGRWNEIKQYFANIKQGEKNDVSGVFTNNDFGAGNVNGWDITYKGGSTEATNIGYQYSSGTYDITIPETGETVKGYMNGEAWISGFIEAWKDGNSPNFLGDGSITQTIPALPAGKYMLAVDAICSNQGRTNVDGNPNHYPDDVQLFAKASIDGSEYYTNVFTKDGKPEHFEFTFIHNGGEMTLGLRVINSAEATMPANWIAMDNLELFYYGEVKDDPEKVFLDAAIAKAEETYPADEFNDLKAYLGDKDNYTTTLAAVKKVSNEGGDYAAAQKTLEESTATLAESVAAYKKLSSLQEEAEERMAQFDNTKFAGISDELGDMLMDWDEAYVNCSYTIEEINGLEAQLSAAINDFVSENLEAGDDITFMINNPNFDKDFSGWATTGAVPAWGGINANPNGSMSNITMESGDAEVFHQKFTMSQTVYNMPAGLYQFTCQGFVRCDDGSSNEGSLYAIINGEEQTSSLPLIGDYATDEQLFSDGTWWDDVSGSNGWIPNGMPGANYHFSHTIEGNEFPDYTATLNVTLKEAADVTVGVKCTNTSNWVIFDNFKLTYLGDGADAYMAAIEQKLAELQKYIENAEDEGKIMGSEVAKKYEDLEAEKKSLKTSEDCIAFIAKIDDALAYAKKSVEAYAEAENVMFSLIEAIEESENAALANEANTYVSSVSDDINDATATVEELETIISKMKGYITQLAMPINYADATDENPIDVSAVIINSTFDEIGNFEGWSEGFGAGGTTSTNAECYQKAFDVYQDIEGLPAGTYQVSVQGYYRQGSSANDYTNTQTESGTPAYNAVIYATGDNTTSEAPIMSICADMMEEKLAGNTSVGDGAYWVPNTMAEATVWFDSVDDEGEEIGYYTNKRHPEFNAVIVKVGEDGKLRIGVKKDVTIESDWAIFDNFKLIYFGTNSSKTPDAIANIDAAATKANGKYFQNGQIFIMKNGVKYNVAGQKLR